MCFVFQLRGGTCSNCFELQKAASGMCLAPSPTLGGGKDVG